MSSNPHHCPSNAGHLPWGPLTLLSSLRDLSVTPATPASLTAVRCCAEHGASLTALGEWKVLQSMEPASQQWVSGKVQRALSQPHSGGSAGSAEQENGVLKSICLAECFPASKHFPWWEAHCRPSGRRGIIPGCSRSQNAFSTCQFMLVVVESVTVACACAHKVLVCPATGHHASHHDPV
eukprot:1161474-Pelagomonas_calceolata.AAC.11